MGSRRVANAVLVSFFLTTIGAYTYTSACNSVVDRAGLLTALREPWRSFAARIENHYTAHLAGREAIVAAHAHLKADWFHASPNPKVWLGRDGWLFFNHTADTGYVPPYDAGMPARLDRWATVLSARQAWMAERGIKYIVVAAPNKQSVYPDLLPRLARRPGPAPLDDLIARCDANSDLSLLDLRETFRAARPDSALYFRTDSHWSPAGDYVGCAATVGAIGLWYPIAAPMPPMPPSPQPTSYFDGDLARLIGLAGRMREPTTCLIWPDLPRARPVIEDVAFRADAQLNHVRPSVWVNGTPGLPRVVLLADSFAGDHFCSLLAEHCSRLVRVGSYDGQEALIDRERPDVVIFEFVERILENYVPQPPLPGRASWRKDDADQSVHVSR